MENRCGLKCFLMVFLACLLFSFFCNVYFGLKGSTNVPVKLIKLASTAPIFEQYDNITLPPKGFLVWNEHCRIPRLEVYSQKILENYVPLETIVCSKKEPLVSKTFETKYQQYFLHINETQLKDSFYTCCYKEIRQQKIHYLYNSSYCMQFDDNFPVPKHIRFGITVHCSYLFEKKPFYQDAFFFFQTNISANEQEPSLKSHTEPNGASNYDIMLIAIDSMSQFNFPRTMPRTFAFLRRNAWFELSGYNKMNSCTFPNVLALLAGLGPTDSNRNCYAYKQGFIDSCHLLFQKFKNHGFSTAYAEDLAYLSTFQYWGNKFHRPPTDFYMIPLMNSFEKETNLRSRSGRFCIGERITANLVYDAATEFMLSNLEQPKFGFFWTNSFSHAEFYLASAYDEHMLAHMEKWKLYGLFQKNVFIFLSDHGMRQGKLRQYSEGYYEERLPMIFIWLPPHLRAKHPEFVYALTVNKNRLTSPYDIYMTLQHFLQLSVSEAAISPAKSCLTCQTVLKPIAENRSCAEAGLTPHWCACESYYTVEKSSLMADITNLIVQEINGFLTTNAPLLCKVLELDAIQDANVKMNHFNVKQKKYEALDLNALDPESKGITFRVTFVTRPEFLEYEATFLYFRNSHKIDFSINEISLAKVYGNLSWCVSDHVLKRFCMCY